MSHYQLHSKFNLIIILPIFVGILYFYFTRDLYNLAFFLLAFVYSTLYAHPDMDMANQIKLFSFYGFMTLPYRLFYSPFFKHRGKVSHSLLWGTPSRLFALLFFIGIIVLIYLLSEKIWTESLNKENLKLVFFELLYILYFAFIDLFRLIKINYAQCLYFILGFYIADFGHILLDRLSRR